jgi:YjbE family integral membrane protein
MSILLVEWLPIRLVGGILLIKITWDLVKSSTVVESSTEPISKNASKQYGKAVLYTIIADLSMSLENILAVAAFAHGDRILMILGIIFSIPILLFGSQFIAQLMKKYNIILYVGASSLAYTAAAMILEDTLLVDYIPDFLSQGVSILFAIGIFLYGIYNIHKSTQSKSTAEAE